MGRKTANTWRASEEEERSLFYDVAEHVYSAYDCFLRVGRGSSRTSGV